MNDKTPLRELKGVGEKREAFPEDQDHDCGRASPLYPRTYDIYEEPVEIASAEEDKTVSIRATIATGIYINQIRNLQVLTTTVADASGRLPVAWFNAPLFGEHSKRAVCLSSEKDHQKKGRPMEHPEFLPRQLMRDHSQYATCIWSDEKDFQQDDHRSWSIRFWIQGLSMGNICRRRYGNAISSQMPIMRSGLSIFRKICRSFSQPGNVWYSMNFCFLCWQYSS